MEQGGLEPGKRAKRGVFGDTREGTRTPDPRIKNPLL